MSRSNSPNMEGECACPDCLNPDCGECTGCKTNSENWDTPRKCNKRVCFKPKDFYDPPATTKDALEARAFYATTPPSPPTHSLAPLLRMEMIIEDTMLEAGMRFMYGSHDPNETRLSDMANLWKCIDVWNKKDVHLKNLRGIVRIPHPEQLDRMVQRVAEHRGLPEKMKNSGTKMDMTKEQLPFLIRRQKINVQPGRLAETKYLLAGTDKVCIVLQRMQSE